MSPTTDTGIAAVVGRDDPTMLITEALALAKQLRGDDASKTQLRRLYSTMKQIEMSWPASIEDLDAERAKQKIKERDNAYRELLLFKPRLAYQGNRHSTLKPLVQTLQTGIDAVGKDRIKLQRLSQFFEATLAYYIAGTEG